MHDEWQELFEPRDRWSKGMWILLRKVQRAWRASPFKVHQILTGEVIMDHNARYTRKTQELVHAS